MLFHNIMKALIIDDQKNTIIPNREELIIKGDGNETASLTLKCKYKYFKYRKSYYLHANYLFINNILQV